MDTRRYVLVSLLAGLVLTGAGCISIGGSGGNTASDGGIFKTDNRGDMWAQKTAIPTTTGERRSISGVSISTIVQDPQDPSALYLGSTDSGMFYTYDGGESWIQPAYVSRGRISAIAIHPKNKCILYVTSDNRLLKSEDCSRSWTAPFVDSRTDKRTTAVAIDWYNPSVIWLASNSGDLLRSTDDGASWVPVHSFGDEVMRIMLSPGDTRHVYVATKASGIWRSDDGGANWIDLSVNYSSFPGAKEYTDLAISVSSPGTVILASKYGLIRSMDGGDKWDKIDLLTPPGSTAIYSLAIDPKDANIIYYGTATTFYRSTNGGSNWVPKKLPTSRAATCLLVDEAKSEIMYMGVTRFKN